MPPAPSPHSPATLQERQSLLGLTREQLGVFLRAQGISERQVRMRTSQLWHGLYVRGMQDFSGMSTISKDLRVQLDKASHCSRPAIASEQLSQDGTRKWLIQLDPVDSHDKGALIETVYIPEEDRGTLCVSSQVGCTLTCSFCHTGTQRLVRNLTAAEIVAQFVIARDRLNDWPNGTPDACAPNRVEGTRAITNIVFMGMGEPLYNLDAVSDAIDILSDNEGLSLSRRRMTVSTSGVVPQMEALGHRTSAMLAISLHAVCDDLRNELVPLNRKYPIGTLLQACRDYPGLSNARRITFEYVMLKAVNDSDSDARALVQLLKGIPAKINLIPFNPWPGTRYECSNWDRIERFSQIIFDAGYASPVRTPRGRDILAACGQLKSATEKLGARARLMLEENII
jgi:23S rRNA (adenine2503-C2)-methyltransferase